jgi:hypothetical protein
VLGVVRERALRRTNHSSRGVLPTVARRMCDLENLVIQEAIARDWVAAPREKKKDCSRDSSAAIVTML